MAVGLEAGRVGLGGDRGVAGGERLTVARWGEGEVMWIVGVAGRVVEEARVESMEMGVEDVDDVWGSSGWQGRGDFRGDRGGGVGGRRSRVGDVGTEVESKGTLECES